MLLGNYFQNINDNYKKFSFSGISFDSNQINKNYIFFAIKGNRTDGNDFIQTAIRNGAKIIITENLWILSPQKILNEIQNNVCIHKNIH